MKLPWGPYCLCSGAEQAFEGTGAFWMAACWACAISEDYMNTVLWNILQKEKNSNNKCFCWVDSFKSTVNWDGKRSGEREMRHWTIHLKGLSKLIRGCTLYINLVSMWDTKGYITFKYRQSMMLSSDTLFWFWQFHTHFLILSAGNKGITSQLCWRKLHLKASCELTS